MKKHFFVFQAGPWLELPATRRNSRAMWAAPARQPVLQQGPLRWWAPLICQTATSRGNYRYKWKLCTCRHIQTAINLFSCLLILLDSDVALTCKQSPRCASVLISFPLHLSTKHFHMQRQKHSFQEWPPEGWFTYLFWITSGCGPQRCSLIRTHTSTP